MLRKLGILAVSLAMALIPTNAYAGSKSGGPRLKGNVSVRPSGNLGTTTNKVKYITTRVHTTYVPPDLGNIIKFTSPLTPTNTSPKCPKKLDGRFATGITTRSLINQIYNNKNEDQNTRTLTTVCHYPADPATTHVTCSLSAQITVSGAMAYGKTISSPWSRGDTDPADCHTSLDLPLDMALNKLGQYTITGTGILVPCTRYDYGPSQPPAIRDCGGNVPSTWYKEIQIWCNGWSDDHSGNHTFTMQECMTGAKPAFTCKASFISLDTLLKPNFGVLDDGRKHTADWTPTGLETDMASEPFRKFDVQETKVTVETGSTPSRSGVPQDASNQRYLAPADGWTPGGDIHSIPLRWYAPSMAGAAWVMNRHVSYTAEFKSPVVTLTIMNMETGLMSPPVVTSSWKADHGECKSAQLRVTVKRARNIR